MKSRSRIWNATVMGAIMAGVLALLPGTALAQGEHGVPYRGGGGHAGTGGEEGGVVAAESGGGDDDRVARAAGCGGGGGGATVGDSAGSSGALRPDSATADIDTSAADVEGFGTMAFSLSAAGSPGLRTAAAAVGCPRPDAAIGGTGDGLVAPNRIDAGAGAGAATSSNGPELFSGGGLMVAIALAALRRRARN